MVVGWGPGAGCRELYSSCKRVLFVCRSGGWGEGERLTGGQSLMDQEEGIRQTDQVPPTADWRAARALTERRERVNRRDVSRGSLMGACVKEFGHARTHLYTKLVLYTTHTQTRARALTLTFSHSLCGSHAQSPTCLYCLFPHSAVCACPQFLSSLKYSGSVPWDSLPPI